MDELGKPIDVLCVTEHNMTPDVEEYLKLPNYTLATSFSREKKRGGSCIMVRTGLNYKVLENVKSFSKKCVVECCAVEICEHNIIIVCLYRIPHLDKIHFNMFHEILERILKTVCDSKNKKVVICGDFNINILKDCPKSRDFKYHLLSRNLKLELNKPTRLGSGTCLDNFAHNVKGTKSEIIETALSDHTAQLLTCPVGRSCVLKTWTINRRDFNKQNLETFRNHIKSLSFHDTLASDDTNVAYNNFIDIFKCLYYLCFPYRTIKKNITVKQKWLTKGIRTCCRKKRKYLWQTRIKKDKKTRENFKEYSKRLKKIILSTQRSQNDHFIKTAKNKTKAMWTLIKNSKAEIPKEPITKIKVNDEYITNPIEIANCFNDYFIDNIEQQNSDKSNRTCNIKNNCYSLFMNPVTPPEVHNVIRSLKNTGSVGFDDMSTKVIKYVSDLIAVPLCHIINLSFCSGMYPKELKPAIVKPLHKKGDKKSLKNYRPIALLSVFSKVFEKLIHGILYSFLEKHNILNKEQKGFRKHNTVNTAIYDLVEKAILCMDQGIASCALYMDMTKAFDHVDHESLLEKLSCYGVRGQALSLIKSYLEDRYQCTELAQICLTSKTEKKYLSDQRQIKFGVPQGSVLGPLLFIIYINDIIKSTEHPMILFADDSTVFIKCNCLNDLIYEKDIKNTLKNIFDWLKTNNLKMNLDKTNIMHFNQRKNRQEIKIDCDGTKVDEVKTTKFLGIFIDSNMSWETHSTEVCKKLYKFSFALYKLAKIADRDTVLAAYHGFVASTLRYGVIFWGNSSYREILLRAQKRCIRAICGLKSTDSCQPHFKSLKLLTFPCLYIFESCIFVKTHPDLFEKEKLIPRLRPRDTKICTNICKTALMRKSVLVMAPRLFNKIPEPLKYCNINKFKLVLSKMLIDKCYYDVNDYLTDNNFKL